MTDIFKSQEFTTISKYYGERKAQRSDVPLILHIVEGCQLLQIWGQDILVQKAFCLHPIAQNHGQIPHFDCHEEAKKLALEYSKIAELYLCKPETDKFTEIARPYQLAMQLPKFSKEVGWMLLADKVQNQSDFRKYHWFKHERAIQLERYFNLWIKTLIEHYL